MHRAVDEIKISEYEIMCFAKKKKKKSRDTYNNAFYNCFV